MKQHLMLSRIFTLVLIVLESMPIGAVMYFMTDSGRIRQTVAYFDPTTYGYASFGPFPTACLTALLALILVVTFFVKKRTLYVTAAAIAVIATLLSLLPLLYGLEWMSGISWCISIILICESVLLCTSAKHPEK